MSAFKAHSLKQSEALTSTAGITLLGTGTQWGKTTAGANWLRLHVCKSADPESNFILTAPNYTILQQSSLPAFLKVFNDLGTYHKADKVFETHWGSHVFIRTATLPDSVVGVPNVKAIWGDEAGKYALYFWENVQARAGATGAPIMLTTSPYSLNWIWKELIKPQKLGKRPDVKIIQAASWENPYHAFYSRPELMEQARATMDPRRFQAIYGGQFERMSGLVYDCFDEDESIVEPFALPLGTKFYGGIDWGYTDPFVLTVRAVTPEGRHYQVSEFYKTGLTITQMMEVARQKQMAFGIERFFCGQDQPGYVEEFNRNRLPCVAVDNDIRRGIDLHYELMKTRQYQIFRGSSPYTVDELETYHYPEPKDLKPDQDSEDQLPVGQNDHCLDSIRYATMALFHSTARLKAPKITLEPIIDRTRETQARRLKRLMQPRSHRSSHSEKWTSGNEE